MTISSASRRSWKPSFFEMRCMGRLSKGISAVIRRRCSGRPTSRRRLRSSVPMPPRWKRSLTRTAGYAHDLTPPRLRVGLLGDQRHLAVVVYKADARQALVGRALIEVHHVEVTHIDALFRECLVEPHHQGLVFGTDRAYRHGRAVAQLFVKDVLLRVRTDRGSWEIFFLRLGVVQNDTGVEGYQALWRGQERVDVEFLYPGLLDDELARANEQPLQGADVDRGPAPDATQRLDDAGSFHHPSGERGGQRREGEG